MSRSIRRSLMGFLPVIVFVGQTACALGDLTILETSDTRLTETLAESTSDSEEKKSSNSLIVIPGLLLAGGALFGLGMGGSGGGGEVLVSRSTADGRSLVNPAMGLESGITDILTPFTPQASLPNIVLVDNLPVIPAPMESSNSGIVPSVPDLTPVFADGNEVTQGITGQSFIPPADTPRASVGGSNGSNAPLPSIGAPTAVPEPSAVLLGSSLLGAGIVWRLRRKKA